MNPIQEAARLCDQERVEEAYNLVSGCISELPESPQAAYVLASCHLRVGRAETAYYVFRYIQKFKDFDGPQLWTSIGSCLAEMGRLEDAEKWYQKAMIAPTPALCSSFASVYTKKGQPEKAVDLALRALTLDPECITAKWNGALALLKLRRWAQGWEWYDALLGHKERPEPPALNGVVLPMWEGKGGTVLIHGEQGLGDEIMFASILPDAIANADKVVCAVDPRLIGLFQRSFPEALFVSRKGKDIVLPEPVEFTHRLALGSLGRLFRRSDSDFPGVAYLKPHPDRVVMYRALLDSLGEGKKYGIMWKGGVGGLDESERALDLNELEPLFGSHHWVSLNHLSTADAETQRFYDITGNKIHHWSFAVRSADYDDTAALVSALDGVVCVTGTVGHLAGALGVPAHVLVPRMPQWRYGHEGDSLPWYKSMKLYRQGESWPVDQAAGAL